MKRQLIIASAVLAVIVMGGAAAVVVTRMARTERSARRPKPVPALALVEAKSWGEAHRAFQLYAPPRDGQRNPDFLSLAIAQLPPEIVENGATIHMLVTVPDWLIFDASGKVNADADGVLLTATDPDVGIGLELGRLELNPHARPADRRWTDLVVKVPPCVRRLALEARPGIEAEANNAFDQLLITVSEPLVFRNGVLLARRGGRRKSTCAETTMAGGCPAKPLPAKCTREAEDAPTRTPSGALHTGVGQS